MSDRKQLEALAEFAGQNGLGFEPHDRFGLSALPFNVMRCPEVNSIHPEANCERIVYGSWKGNTLYAFRIDQYSTGSSDGVSHSYHTAVLGQIPAECRAMDIEHAGLLSRMGFARHRIETGRHDFDHAFKLACTDPVFAQSVLTEPLSDWLLSNGQGWHFQLASRYAIMHRKQERHDSERLGELLDLMTGFCGLIPDQITTQYPLGSQPDPELANRGATGTANLVVRL